MLKTNKTRQVVHTYTAIKYQSKTPKYQAKRPVRKYKTKLPVKTQKDHTQIKGPMVQHL